MSQKVAENNSFSDCVTTMNFQLQHQIESMKVEHQTFHNLMKIVPKEIKDEVIALWVRGTEAAADEAYFRRSLRAELSEEEYRKAQDVAHEAWKAFIAEMSKGGSN